MIFDHNLQVDYACGGGVRLGITLAPDTNKCL